MTPTDRELTAPRWLGPVDDLEETPARILLAAAEMFGEHSPSQVSLRAIAARAGVNYGLIHHYFKTKDAILAELLRRSSLVGAEALDRATSIDDVLLRLFDADSEPNYGPMLAWALLDGSAPERLVAASPVIPRIGELIEQEVGGARGVDADIVAVAAVSAVLGWRLYRPVLTVYAGLSDRDERELTSQVFDAVRMLVRAWIECAPDGTGGSGAPEAPAPRRSGPSSVTPLAPSPPLPR